MNITVAPTKANLLRSKNTLSFSRKGFELLDKKRNILIREMMTLVDRANRIQQEIQTTFDEAYSGLRYANITLGSNTVNEIANSMEEGESYEVLTRSVMGVEIPMVKAAEEKIELQYGVYRTNAAFDQAVNAFTRARILCYELAEVESSVYKLAMEIKKTQKRANALDKIQIPRYEAIVKFIMDALEEKEREDFFRLKKVKSKSKRKKEFEREQRRIELEKRVMEA